MDDIRAIHQLEYTDSQLQKFALSSIPYLEKKHVNVSKNALRTLNRITIQDLKENVLSNGQYLLLRILEPIILTFVAETIVEDHLGNTITLSLRHYFDHDSEIPPENLLTVGTIFALKEPFRQFSIIQCDCPTDLVLIDQNHELYQEVFGIHWLNSIASDTSDEKAPNTASEWKIKGNKLFRAKKYIKSIEAYSMGLKICSEDQKLRGILHLNLSAAYLALDYFENALENALKALAITRTCKALYRTGLAQYQLRQYRNARECYVELLSLERNSKEGVLELKKCEERLLEEAGVIDVYKLCITSIVKPLTPIDCADYVGNLEVVKIPGKGRGVIATRDIYPGTLLVVSKAVQAAFNQNKNGEIDFSIDTRILGQTVRIALKNPITFGNLIHSLCTNDEQLDKEFKLFCDEENKNEPIADVNRVVKIISINSFGLTRKTSGGESRGGGTGLFVFPSFINHFCFYNAAWHVYNDVMVIHSVKHIRQGEEVTISYVDVKQNFITKSEKLLRTGIHCDCNICVVRSSEPKSIHEKRAAISEQLITLLYKQPSPDVVKKMMKQIRQTYTALHKYLLELFLPYMFLAEVREKSLKETLSDAVDEALNCVGVSCHELLFCSENPQASLSNTAFISENFLERAATLMVNVNYYTGNVDECLKWVKVLIMLEKLFTGGDSRMVIRNYKKDIPMIKFLLERIKVQEFKISFS